MACTKAVKVQQGSRNLIMEVDSVAKGARNAVEALNWVDGT